LAEVRAVEADQALAEAASPASAANPADVSACKPILKTTKKPDQSPAFFMD
jgi:hypothetical protein